MTESSNFEPNVRLALKTSVSFVADMIPFIGYNKPSNTPFVGHKQPLERFSPKQRGFTLIELMITLVIAGILLGIGIPNFNSFIKNNRMVSQTNDLLADLIYARSEALKRSRNVHICKTSDPTAAQPVCNNTAGDPWTDGWIVWSDNNSSGTLNYTAVSPTKPDDLLRISEGLSGNNTLVTTDSAIENEIIFDKLGILSGAGGTLHLCDDRGSTFGRTMSLTTAGRPLIGRNPTC